MQNGSEANERPEGAPGDEEPSTSSRIRNSTTQNVSESNKQREGAPPHAEPSTFRGLPNYPPIKPKRYPPPPSQFYPCYSSYGWDPFKVLNPSVVRPQSTDVLTSFMFEGSFMAPRNILLGFTPVIPVPKEMNSHKNLLINPLDLTAAAAIRDSELMPPPPAPPPLRTMRNSRRLQEAKQQEQEKKRKLWNKNFKK